MQAASAAPRPRRALVGGFAAGYGAATPFLRRQPPSHVHLLPRLGHYALDGILASILLNLLLRTFVKVGGLFAILLIAGLALVFARRMHRAPWPEEHRGIVLRYGLGLGVLYPGLLGMMEQQ